ncbi:hypothetical protein B0H11DRAFT_1723684, partial [Mycena galericulata]
MLPDATACLPTELLGEIFLFFLALDNPMILCWVCNRWRVVAMNMVTLWIHPRFYLGPAFLPTHPDADYTGAKTAQYVEEMSRWMKRARSSESVSLSILRRKCGYRWSEPPLLEVLIRPYAGCFRSLTLDTVQEQMISLLEAGP